MTVAILIYAFTHLEPGVVTIFLMYVGGVGPLALAAAISMERPPESHGYAHEDVIIG